MGLNKEDRILIKNLYLFKGYGAKRLMEFPTKFWKKATLNDFLKRLRCMGFTERKSGSGRSRTVRTDENIDAVNELVLVRKMLRSPTILSDRFPEKLESITRLLLA